MQSGDLIKKEGIPSLHLAQLLQDALFGRRELCCPSISPSPLQARHIGPGAAHGVLASLGELAALAVGIGGYRLL
jgi:hypothetical protein